MTGEYPQSKATANNIQPGNAPKFGDEKATMVEGLSSPLFQPCSPCFNSDIAVEYVTMTMMMMMMMMMYTYQLEEASGQHTIRILDM